MEETTRAKAQKKLVVVLFLLQERYEENDRRNKERQNKNPPKESRNEDLFYTPDSLKKLVSNLQRDVDAFGKDQSEARWKIWLAESTEDNDPHHARKKAWKHHIENARGFFDIYGLRAALVLTMVQNFWRFYQNPLRLHRLLVAIRDGEDRKEQEHSSDSTRPHEREGVGAVQYASYPPEDPSRESSSGSLGCKRPLEIDKHPSNPSKRARSGSSIAPITPSREEEVEDNGGSNVIDQMADTNSAICPPSTLLWLGMWLVSPIKLLPGTKPTDLQSSNHNCQHPLRQSIMRETGENQKRVEMAYITEEKIPNSESTVLLYQLHGTIATTGVEGGERNFVTNSVWMYFNVPLEAVPNSALRQSIKKSDIYKRETKVLSRSGCVILMLPIVKAGTNIGPYCYLQCVVPTADAALPPRI
jgi:hypothetical protein